MVVSPRRVLVRERWWNFFWTRRSTGSNFGRSPPHHWISPIRLLPCAGSIAFVAIVLGRDAPDLPPSVATHSRPSPRRLVEAPSVNGCNIDVAGCSLPCVPPLASHRPICWLQQKKMSIPTKITVGHSKKHRQSQQRTITPTSITPVRWFQQNESSIPTNFTAGHNKNHHRF